MPGLMHVDLDAFYASVEMRRDPKLAEVPMWVGGGSRGVVLSANYLAREFGVSGGMSTSAAKRRCPQGVIVSPDFDAYDAASKDVFRILGAVTPYLEAASIDEAYLDVTAARSIYGDPEEVARKIRASVAHFVGVTCSIGIAENRLLAKVASASAKPDGVTVVPRGGGAEFLAPLPVSALPGIGPVQTERLERLGLFRCGQLAHTPEATLIRAFGLSSGRSFLSMANGYGSRTVVRSSGKRNSLGHQHTSMIDMCDLAVLEQELLRVAVVVAARMRAANLVGAGIEVEVRTADWRISSKSMRLPRHTDLTLDLYRFGQPLLKKLLSPRPRIRRLAMRVSQLSEARLTPTQSGLDELEDRQRAIELAVDELSAKYGSQIVGRASLLRCN